MTVIRVMGTTVVMMMMMMMIMIMINCHLPHHIEATKTPSPAVEIHLLPPSSKLH